jgi:hypothetical protein
MLWVDVKSLPLALVLGALLCTAPVARAGFTGVDKLLPAHYQVDTPRFGDTLSPRLSGLNRSDQAAVTLTRVTESTVAEADLVWFQKDPAARKVTGRRAARTTGSGSERRDPGPELEGTIGRDSLGHSAYLLCWENEFAQDVDWSNIAFAQDATAAAPLLIPLPPAASTGLMGLASMAGIGLIRTVRRRLRIGH